MLVRTRKHAWQCASNRHKRRRCISNLFFADVVGMFDTQSECCRAWARAGLSRHLPYLHQVGPERTQDAQVLHMRQQPQVSRQQRQARPHVDDQLASIAVMAPDVLAALEGWQASPFCANALAACSAKRKAQMSVHYINLQQTCPNESTSESRCHCISTQNAMSDRRLEIEKAESCCLTP